MLKKFSLKSYRCGQPEQALDNQNFYDILKRMKPELGIKVRRQEDNRGNRVVATEITTEQGGRFSVTTQGISGIRDDGKNDYVTLFHRTSPRSRKRPQIAILNETEVTKKTEARKMHKEAVGAVIQLLEQGNPNLIASVFENRAFQLLFETHNPQ